MYYLDPQRGRRRRAHLRNQASYSVSQANRAALGATLSALKGLSATCIDSLSKLRHRWVSDETLEQRVRSQLEQHVSHPSSIRIVAKSGRVTLSGRILRDEIDQFVSAVQSIHGVQSVENALDAFDRAARESQSRGSSSEDGPDGANRRRWSPAARIVAGAAGAALMANCLSRRSPLAILLGSCGFGLCTRAATNQQTGQILGSLGKAAGDGAQHVFARRAPVDQVVD
jgi:hypothetical protein